MDPHDHTSDIKIDDVRQIVEAGNPTNMGFDFDQAFWRGHWDACARSPVVNSLLTLDQVERIVI
jgi:hypothetical protein